MTQETTPRLTRNLSLMTIATTRSPKRSLLMNRMMTANCQNSPDGSMHWNWRRMS